jgi:hypothetical protein
VIILPLPPGSWDYRHKPPFKMDYLHEKIQEVRALNIQYKLQTAYQKIRELELNKN